MKKRRKKLKNYYDMSYFLSYLVLFVIALGLEPFHQLVVFSGCFEHSLFCFDLEHHQLFKLGLETGPLLEEEIHDN